MMLKLRDTENAQRHNWVCRKKWNLSVAENFCTETGDVQLHTNLPVDENTLRKLYKDLGGSE
jgi:hypothetical protein